MDCEEHRQVVTISKTPQKGMSEDWTRATILSRKGHPNNLKALMHTGKEGELKRSLMKHWHLTWKERKSNLLKMTSLDKHPLLAFNDHQGKQESECFPRRY